MTKTFLENLGFDTSGAYHDHPSLLSINLSGSDNQWYKRYANKIAIDLSDELFFIKKYRNVEAISTAFSIYEMTDSTHITFKMDNRGRYGLRHNSFGYIGAPKVGYFVYAVKKSNNKIDGSVVEIQDITDGVITLAGQLGATFNPDTHYLCYMTSAFLDSAGVQVGEFEDDNRLVLIWHPMSERTADMAIEFDSIFGFTFIRG